jgi:hypothetical protein
VPGRRAGGEQEEERSRYGREGKKREGEGKAYMGSSNWTFLHPALYKSASSSLYALAMSAKYSSSVG